MHAHGAVQWLNPIEHVNAWVKQQLKAMVQQARRPPLAAFARHRR